MTISQKVFELLREKGLSQKDFSMATGIPQSTISDWRKNKVSYRIVTKGTEEDMLLDTYEKLDVKAKGRLLGYMEALKE